jgi:hypothetical protein
METDITTAGLHAPKHEMDLLWREVSSMNVRDYLKAQLGGATRIDLFPSVAYTSFPGFGALRVAAIAP